jgi:hypothetical protein
MKKTNHFRNLKKSLVHSIAMTDESELRNLQFRKKMLQLFLINLKKSISKLFINLGFFFVFSHYEMFYRTEQTILTCLNIMKEVIDFPLSNGCLLTGHINILIVHQKCMCTN